MVDLSASFIAAKNRRFWYILQTGVSGAAMTCAGLFGAAVQARAQTAPMPNPDPIGEMINKFESIKPHTLDGGGSKPLFKMKNGDWQYGEHKIKGDIFNLIQTVSAENGFPLRLILDVIARESSFNPAAQNESGACGLIQFMPSTLYEMTYKYGNTLKGYEDQALQNRIVKKRIPRTDGNSHRVTYEPKTPEDAAFLRQSCFNPEFNLRLGIKYKMEVAAMLQQWMDGIKGAGKSYYPLKSHELYLGFFAGPNAAEKIIRDVKMGRDIPITLYFSDAALHNPANKKVLFKDKDGKTPYTGLELLRNIAKSMGYNPNMDGLDMPALPDVRKQVFNATPAPRQIEDLIPSL